MFNVHCYRRVSSEKQVDNNSLDTQDGAINKRLADEKFSGQTVLRYVDPAVSAFTPWFERPAGVRLFEQLAPGDHIIVATFDRAFRSLLDLCKTLDTLKERDVTLHCLDLPVDLSTSIGQAVFKIIAVVKELERKTISERVKAVNQWKRENGLPVSSQRPLGYKTVGHGKNRRYIPWKEERQFAMFCLELHQDGMSRESIWWYVQAQNNKKIPVPGGLEPAKSCARKIQHLMEAALEDFPLPDGSRIPTSVKSAFSAQTSRNNGNPHPSNESASGTAVGCAGD